MCDMLKRLFFSFLCFYVSLTSKTSATFRNSWNFRGGLASKPYDHKVAPQFKFGQPSFNTAGENEHYRMSNYEERNLND